MHKAQWKPGNMIYPLPVAMVSCGISETEYNIITVGWTGTICTNPAMCFISLKPERYSYGIIKKNMEFVINLTTKELCFAADWCGVKSGRDFDKFREMDLTPYASSMIKTPLILESPVNIECKVKEIKPLGSHDMFIADVAAVNASRKFINAHTQEFNFFKAHPVCYSHGKYYAMGDFIGKFGFSVQKRKIRKK